MFERILVPLDGSSLAESVLPAVAYLMEVCGAEVALLHLVESNAPHQVHGERHLSAPDEAQGYLDELARRLPHAAPIAAHVHTAAVDDVVRAIVAHANELDSDLIVLATHARSQLGAFWAGSMAPRVSSKMKKPLLLVPVCEPGLNEEVAQRQSIAQVLEAFNDAFNRHDVAAMMGLMTEDCVFENTYPPPDGARYAGAREVGAFWRQFFADSPQAEIAVEEIFVTSDRAAQRWTYRWTDAAGRQGHVRGVDVFHFRAGKIAAKLSYVKG